MGRRSECRRQSSPAAPVSCRKKTGEKVGVACTMNVWLYKQRTKRVPARWCDGGKYAKGDGGVEGPVCLDACSLESVIVPGGFVVVLVSSISGPSPWAISVEKVEAWLFISG